MNKLFLAAIIAGIAASPASAATWVLGGANANLASVVRSAEGVDLSFTARRFSAQPGSLTNLSDLGAVLNVSVTAPGLGVSGGASAPQIDTNQANRREALLVSASKRISVSGLKLSFVDANDTLQIYGIGDGGALTDLGFGGTIRTGLDGAASFVNSGANSGTTLLTFLEPTRGYSGFLFTTRIGGDVVFGGNLGQGYRVDSISATPVPEASTWAMLIAGFGLVGLAIRRQPAAARSA